MPCLRNAGDNGTLSPRELDLQQQRQHLLQSSLTPPRGGYLAICLVVRNQHADLPEWLDYHAHLGAAHIYVMDDSSNPPLDNVLAPFVGVRSNYECPCELL